MDVGMVTGYNREFVDRILQRYQTDGTGYFAGSALIHRIQKDRIRFSLNQKFMKRLLTKEIYKWIKKYEQKYYQKITNADNRRFIRTVEQIYSQPGDKKQLLYMFQKLGVITKNQSEWQETKLVLKQHEEEMMKLRRQISLQEKIITRLSVQEDSISVKGLTREVMERIKSEIRMERLRYGPDS